LFAYIAITNDIKFVRSPDGQGLLNCLFICALMFVFTVVRKSYRKTSEFMDKWAGNLQAALASFLTAVLLLTGFTVSNNQAWIINWGVFIGFTAWSLYVIVFLAYNNVSGKCIIQFTDKYLVVPESVHDPRERTIEYRKIKSLNIIRKARWRILEVAHETGVYKISEAFLDSRYILDTISNKLSARCSISVNNYK
jgi:hypothetical protein